MYHSIYLPNTLTLVTIMSDTTYANGYVYRLWSLFSDSVYIGSTHKPINERLNKHRNLFVCGRKGTRAALLFAEVGVDSVQIELLASFTNITKKLLEMHEQRWIDDSPNALNRNRATKKPSFPKKDPAYYIRHMFSMNGDQVESIPISLDKVRQQQKSKDWYSANIDKVRAYYQSNRDKALQANRAYYYAKKQEILDAAKAKREANKVYCEACKKHYGQFAIHLTSKKHRINSGKVLITPLVGDYTIANNNTPGYYKGLITPLVADTL